jgi:putative MATE family efflux protein
MAMAATASRADSATEPQKVESSYRRMWQIGWPVSVSTSTVSLFMIANLFWIGHLGTDAVAAVATCGHALFILFGVAQSILVGTLAIVSRRVGEGRLDDAYFAGLHAAILGAVLGGVVGVVGWIAAPSVVRFFQAGEVVEQLAIPYLRIALTGEIFLFVSLAIGAVYSGAGDTRIPMVLNGIVVSLNAVLDPFFIFAPGERIFFGVDVGWLGWGVRGAAVADVIAGFVGICAFAAVSVVMQRPFPRPRGKRFVLQTETFRQIVRVGAPASISFMARPLSTFFLIRVIASFGTVALAAFGIALRSFSINWIFYSGVNAAVSTLVGQNLGARNVHGAERVISRGVRVAFFLALCFCFVYGTLAADFMAFFDSNPEVVATGVPFLQLIAFGFLASGTTLPLVAAMNGAGDTRPPMVVAFLANWPIKLPLCWALAVPFGYGTNGIWTGMLVSIVVEAAIVTWWFRYGTWKRRRV